MTTWSGDRYFPLENRDALLHAEPGELGYRILQYLNEVTDGALGQGLHDLSQERLLRRLHDAWNPQAGQAGLHQTDAAVREAWAWLEARGLLTVNERGEAIVTPKGRAVRDRAALDALIPTYGLPRAWLHPAFRETAGPLYDQGNYEAAVLHARESVEAVVRQVTGLSPAETGPELMRQAFGPGRGELADTQAPNRQQQATADLFAGALGHLRQRFAPGAPHLTDAVEAAELLMLASHLLRQVEVKVRPAAPGDNAGKAAA